MSLRQHTSQEFEAELESVRQRIFEMGRHVDQVLDSAGKALMAGDSELGERIIAGDDETDSMELDIDHLCLEILARRQPVAGDLRLLTSALKLVIDLERIGDLGVSIAGRVVELKGEPPLIPYEDLLRMMTTAREMLTEALEALNGQDVARASRVIDKDEVVDAYYSQIFNDVLSRMRESPENLFRATRVQAISKYIERIGDHAANVAERVIFIVTGEDVRHLARMSRSDFS
ncbi:MAG TPA: phosphate signaling complex protein PhoU [Polyangia bacterium]